MSEFRQKRLDFKNQLVQRGVPRVPTLQEMLWVKKFHQPIVPSYEGNLRLLNHFKLGADPEFIFELPADPLEGRNKHRVDASALGLKPGLFAGADQNGRLVEIRPTPHRSALHVVASILESFRWLAILYPKTMEFNWITGAYLYDDGLGGHIHIGRKRPTRALEVNALDAVNKALEGLNVYPVKELQKRRLGDAHGQQYGLPGQYRLQMHGYEYRTPPSWLDNPWLAFFNLTLAKLAILNPLLVSEWLSPDIHVTREMLLNLLAYYKGQDDDAALAHAVCLKNGLPHHTGKDFRARWGIDYSALHKVDVTAIPASITPSEQTVAELFKHLSEWTPLPKREPEVNWSPTQIPDGFTSLLTQVKPRQLGMGELVWDVVSHKKYPVSVYPGGDDQPKNHMLSVSASLAQLAGKDLFRKFKALAPPDVYMATSPANIAGELSITINRKWRKDAKQLSRVKKVLLGGLFPLWQLKDAKSDVLSQWEKPVSEKKLRGTEVMSLREGER